MKLRDLKPDQLRELQKRCLDEYAKWIDTNPDKTKQDVWQWAFSRGLSAGLELEREQ